MLTVLRGINGFRLTVGSLPFAVERLDFHDELGRRSDGRIFVHVALGLRVRDDHLCPLDASSRFKDHDVTKVRPVVVLLLDRLVKTKKKKRQEAAETKTNLMDYIRNYPSILFLDSIRVVSIHEPILNSDSTINVTKNIAVSRYHKITCQFFYYLGQ